MLDLYITVDTELWPFSPGWPVNPLPADVSNFDAEFAVYFDGRTAGGDFGVPYQLALLARYGLKASYFVEPLFSLVAGPDYLQRMVACIESAGQEAQLHLHTEWLGEIRHPKLPAERRQHLRQYDLAEQTRIVEVASGLLQQAGAPAPCAFRAGNYGANFDSLRALAANGIRFDTSHNYCYLHEACGLDTQNHMLGPQTIAGVIEFPVGYFSDYTGHFRHLQFCACSLNELKHVLLQAERRAWSSLVLVMHPFELIRKREDLSRQGLAQPIHSYVRRFELFCKFLSEQRNRIRTRHFRDLEPNLQLSASPEQVLSSNPLRTAGRMAEQLLARVY